jgi:MFS family permease
MVEAKDLTDDIVLSETKDIFPSETIRSKGYLVYLISILSIFQIYRSYTIDGPKTTALVWYFFPDVEFELGLTYLSYVGLIAGLGGFLAIYVQKYADHFGRKPILILISLIMATMSLVQLLTDSLILFTIAAFFITLAGNIHVWMIYMSEEAPKGKNAKWSTIVLMVGILGPVIFNITRFFFITNDKEFTILHWKNVLYFSIIAGFVITFIIAFSFKETSAYEIKDLNATKSKIVNAKENHSVILGLSKIFKSNTKKAYLTLLIVTILVAIGFGAGNIIEPYMMNYSAMSSQEYSILVIVSLICSGVILYLITGKIADSWGRKPILIIYSILYPVSVILQYLWAAHITIAPLRFGIMLPLKIVAMSSRGGIWTLTTLISIELIPTELRGVGNGLQTFVMIAISIVRLLIVAPLFPVLGIQMIAIILCFFMFPVMPLVVFLIPETRGRDLKKVIIN